MTVYRNCQRHQTAFHTFHLHHQVNVNKVVNYKEWEDLKMLFLNFTTIEKTVTEVLEPSLQLNLQVRTFSFGVLFVTFIFTQITSPVYQFFNIEYRVTQVACNIFIFYFYKIIIILALIIQNGNIQQKM